MTGPSRRSSASDLRDGRQDAIIVDDDADLDEAVAGVVKSAFGCGSKCSACSRVIVLDKIHDAFCERLKDAVDALHIGVRHAPGSTLDRSSTPRRLKSRSLSSDRRNRGTLLAQAPAPKGALCTTERLP